MMRSLLCLLLAVAGLQLYERPLDEQQLQRLLPVLRADVTATEQRARRATAEHALDKSRVGARQQASVEIERGADPLEWLGQRSHDVAAPSTAVYHSACSRALTASDGRPSAVLSFGIAAPPGWLFVWRERDAGALVAPPATSNGPAAPTTSSSRAQAIVQQARAFYAARNFEYVGETAPFEWQFVASDKRVSATVMGVNVLGRVEPCRTLANGPAVVIRAEDEAFGKAAASGRPASGATARSAFEASLDKAGLTETEYLNLKLQLLAARKDAAAEDAGRAIAGRDPAESGIRHQNAQFYRDHRAVLDPILDTVGS